jgi:hypothetical protein
VEFLWPWRQQHGSFWYASLTAVSCGVAVALSRAIFVAADVTVPTGTLFFGWYVAKSDSESMSRSACWREYRCVKTECVAIAKIEMSGIFNQAGVERFKNTHTHK